MDRQVPSRLYKYQALSTQNLVALKARTLWFARPSRLNDPFDCAVPWTVKPVTNDDCLRLLIDRTDPKWAQIKNDLRYIDQLGQPTPELIRSVQAEANDALSSFAAQSYGNRGVTCFSESPDSTLLWSHYGGEHRGICLEFDTSSPWLNKFHPVKYSDDLPECDVVDMLTGDFSRVLSLLLTKASCWSYEQEWRAIHSEPDKEYCYGIDALTGVYLGTAMSDSEKDIVGHVLHGTNTKLYEVKRTTNSFRLEVVAAQYTPYQRPGPVSSNTR
jgi:hypothetical protein